MHGAFRFTPLFAVLSGMLAAALAAGCASGGDGDAGIRADVRPMDVPMPMTDTPMVDTGDITPDVPIGDDTGGGGCLPACTGSQMCCGGACVDTTNNANHCGVCGNRCPIGMSCTASSCGGGSCTPACDTGETCTAGTCMCGAAAACADTLSCCGGGCVDTSTSALHCGVCGRACPGGQTCVGGTCTAPTCTPACTGGTTCVSGVCLCGGISCAAGQGCCGGVCTRLDTVANCGACGRVCAGSDSCCPGAGGGVCVNTSTNVDHCGGCGEDCGGAYNGCVGSVCACGGRTDCLACLENPFPIGGPICVEP